MSYQSELSNLQFQGNAIIRIAGNYFGIRPPDSGLVMQRAYSDIVTSLILNPTQIDIRRVSSTIAQFGFKLLDKDLAVSNLVRGDASQFIGQQVDIWVGRSGVAMDFSQYLQLQSSVVSKVDYVDGAYTFSSTENTDRINKPVFKTLTKLSGDMLDVSTSFLSQNDISEFPASGYLVIDKEVMSYSSKNNTTRIFSGLVRGHFTTTPSAHADGTDVFAATVQTAVNPIDIALKLILSPGGGSIYDVFPDGAGIDQSLIDVAGIEALRASIFPNHKMNLLISNEDTALSFIESEIFAPLRLRFALTPTGKLTIKQSDTIAIRDAGVTLTDDTIRPTPKWVVDGNMIVNRIEVSWDWDQDNGKFLRSSVYQDADSIAKYGKKAALTFSFKGPKQALGGQAIVDDFGNKMLARLSVPSPDISLTTHMDSSLLNILDRPYVQTTQLPNYDGSIHFANELEVVSRGINWQTGDVTLRLAFNSGTFNRFGYISPSDSFVSAASQTVATLGAGRGPQWLPGWKVRLWDNTARAYTADPVNTIQSVSTDTITFATAWATTITGTPTRYMLKFADYDEVVDDQKRYGFVSATGAEVFFDGKKKYVVTF